MRSRSNQDHPVGSHKLRGDFPSQNRESGRKTRFSQAGKTLEKVKMHIVIRAWVTVLCICAVAAHAYAWLEGVSNLGRSRVNLVATHAYAWLEGGYCHQFPLVHRVAAHAYAWLEGCSRCRARTPMRLQLMRMHGLR